MTEQEIFKKFEELGYEVVKGKLKISLFHKTKDIEISIWLKDKLYCKAQRNGTEYEWFTLAEHQLLTKLFCCYRWTNETNNNI